ncbi:MAG: tetratricopeptide repeat protein, partial [Candidatus Omnitrophica bacterium]|nr:tetratricopeptide repeat protein [Candidatus Omnitrophota bacterium]
MMQRLFEKGDGPLFSGLKIGLLPFFLLLAVIGFLLYANALDGAFLLDDHHLITKNAHLRSFRHLDKIFTEDMGEAGGESYNYYRPLQIVSYLIDYHFWKLDVRGYHFTSVLLHILTAFTLFLFLRQLAEDDLLASLSSIFFLVHPVHVETVAYVACRDSILSALFLLLSFIFYLRRIHRRRTLSLLLTVMCYLLALFSREVSVMFPLLVVCYHFSSGERADTKPLLGLGAATLLYFLFKLLFVGSVSLSLPDAGEALRRIPGFFAAFTAYVRTLVIPSGLHLKVGDEFFAWRDPQVITGMSTAVVCLLTAVRARRRYRLFSFGLLWFFVLLLPASNIYPLCAYKADRWLYLPSMGIFVLFALLLTRLLKSGYLSRMKSGIIISLFLLYAALSMVQTTYWRDAGTVLERSLRYSPRSYRVLDMLGTVYHAQDRSGEAIELYKRAIQLNPSYASAYNNMGILYAGRGDTETGIRAFNRAIELDPGEWGTFYNLANLLRATGDTEAALDLYRRAIRMNPYASGAYNNLGLVHFQRGELDEAVQSYRRSIELAPDA